MECGIVGDIEPFFLGQDLTYYDLGPRNGFFLRGLKESRLRVVEAYLFESDILFFRSLTQNLENQSGVFLYNKTLGESGSGSLRGSFDAAVVKDDGGPNGVVAKSTLDECFHFESGVSLLRVDWRSLDNGALYGAKAVFSSGKVDAVFVELSFQKNNRFSAIEDVVRYMSGFGYRVFKLYEPLGHQEGDICGSVFLSPSVSSKNSYELTLELEKNVLSLKRIKQDLKQVESRLDESADEITMLENRLEQAKISKTEECRIERAKNSVFLRHIKVLQSDLENKAADFLRMKKKFEDLEAAQKTDVRKTITRILKVFRAPFSVYRLVKRRFLPIVRRDLKSPRSAIHLPKNLCRELRSLVR